MFMMRRAKERGSSNFDWLASQHSFSFADYYDPQWMGFSCLRVINEDTVQPGKGFGQHPHKNMEIISYVIDGALEHKDSLGTGSIIRPGEIQRMSAGTGIVHSEFNYSDINPVHFLQIWILPESLGIKPGYEQKPIKKIANQWILIGSQDAGKDTILIHQNVKLFAATLSTGTLLPYSFTANRRGWLQMIKGKIQLNETVISCGDGIGMEGMETITITCIEEAELLFFDLN
ncbi:MAG: pirin family protein [Tatlockia sp.]|jgi:hypothetical protein